MKTGPLRFTSCIFKSSDQIGTKFGTNHRYFIDNINRDLFESPLENKVPPFSE